MIGFEILLHRTKPDRVAVWKIDNPLPVGAKIKDKKPARFSCRALFKTMHYALLRGLHNFHYSVYDTSTFITMRQILLSRSLYFLLQKKG